MTRWNTDRGKNGLFKLKEFRFCSAESGCINVGAL